MGMKALCGVWHSIVMGPYWHPAVMTRQFAYGNQLQVNSMPLTPLFSENMSILFQCLYVIVQLMPLSLLYFFIDTLSSDLATAKWTCIITLSGMVFVVSHGF